MSDRRAESLGPVHVRYLRPWEVDAAFVESWRRLEAASIEPNAYLSPSFVLPAIEHLAGADDVYLLAASRDEPDGAGRLCGLTVLVHKQASALLPLPHMRAFRPKHSFLSGVLLDDVDAAGALRAMVEHVRTSEPRAFGLHLPEVAADGPTATLLRELVPHRQWLPLAERERACLDIDALRVASRWDEHISSGRRKKYRRSLRRLGELGEVSWSMELGSGTTGEAVEAFLELEDKGWKGEAGSSLLADRAGLAFFRAAADAFDADGALLMTLLRVDEAVVAATCNFVSGSEVFAFKVGWDPDLSAHSPGIVNELKLIEHLADSSEPFTMIDSGAAEGSFIEPYWPARKRLENVMISFDTIGRAGARLARSARQVRRALVTGRAAIGERIS